DKELMLSGAGAGLLMQGLGQRYVQYVNRTYQRTGTLWEGRFRSCLVQEENYVLACHRYIEMNPVRAVWLLIRATIAGPAIGQTHRVSYQAL
ncbi:transposase, partial [Pseudomonas sp. Root569]|uniref:transposase n=1 Tax=Pseudomonas sp. Root569 TaxID=1736566 RepID=UPI003FA6E8BE